MGKFQVNQIVSGVAVGKFIILSFRQIGGEDYAQVKPCNCDGIAGRGEFALPLVALRPL
jgi:hypothetical protein